MTSIEVSTQKDFFQISLPASFGLKAEGQRLWPLSQTLDWAPEKISFSWKSAPEILAVELPNKQHIQITRFRIPLFSRESPIHFVAPLLGAFTFHMLVGALISLTPSTPERKYSKISVELVQPKISSRHVESSQLDPSDDGFGLRSKLNRTKALLSQFKLKKKPANKGQADSKHEENVFSKRGEAFSKSWSLTKEIMRSDSKPLNLTDAQIQTALQKAYSKLKDCYEDLLIRDSSLQGQPELRIDVNALGKISDVHLFYLKAKPESLLDLRRCFAKAYAEIQMPKPNQDFQVIHTLVLSSN
jgi:hypothetical protein